MKKSLKKIIDDYDVYIIEKSFPIGKIHLVSIGGEHFNLQCLDLKTLVEEYHEKGFNFGNKINIPTKRNLEIAKQKSYRKGAEDERQFILNILDGIDIADKETGNVGGGTKAIRLALQIALQSRIID